MAVLSKDRSAAYRQRIRESGGGLVQITLDKSVIEVVDDYIGIAGNSRAEVIEGALTGWACDAAEALQQLKAKMAERAAQQINSTMEVNHV